MEVRDWPDLRAGMVVFEDADVVAFAKPPGLSVTGERHEPDIVAMAKDHGEHLHPVHRIDKVTSGLVLLAKTLAAHGPLTRQFAHRSVRKGYLAVVRGEGLPASWTVDLPLAVGRKNRVRVAGQREAIVLDDGRWELREPVATDRRSYPSVTVVHRLHEDGGVAALLALPVTGRRHQIRVHLAWTGTPILGDPLFPSTSRHDGSSRTFLHSWRLTIDGPGELVAPPDAGFWTPLGTDALGMAEALWTSAAARH